MGKLAFFVPSCKPFDKHESKSYSNNNINSKRCWNKIAERLNHNTMKTTKKKIKMIVEKTNTGFSAYSDEYPIFTTGRTISELINNAYEAAQLCFIC